MSRDGQRWQGAPTCRCTDRDPSPIILDLAGDNFALTDRTEGVPFDLDGNGYAEQTPWTTRGSDDAWLALDRDGDGRITSGRELFGNFTEQPDPPAGQERNGFLALAEFDKMEHGGNGDGVIDAGDAIHADLRLWQDANHNGASEPAEVFTLPALDMESISLDYRAARRRDRHGNEFRYRAKVYSSGRGDLGRWAYDVFLLASP